MQVWINCISTSSSLFSSPSTMLKRAKQHLKCCGCKIREHQTLLLIKSDHVLVQSLIKIEKSSFWSFLHLATEKISNAKDLVWFWLSFPAHSPCWSSFGDLTDPPFASVLVLPLCRGDLGSLSLGSVADGVVGPCLGWVELGWSGDEGLVLSGAGTEAQILLPHLWGWYSTPGQPEVWQQPVPHLGSGAGGTNITQTSQNISSKSRAKCF